MGLYKWESKSKPESRRTLQRSEDINACSCTIIPLTHQLQQLRHASNAAGFIAVREQGSLVKDAVAYYQLFRGQAWECITLTVQEQQIIKSDKEISNILNIFKQE